MDKLQKIINPNVVKMIGELCMVSEEAVKENKKVMLKELRMLRCYANHNDKILPYNKEARKIMLFHIKNLLQGKFAKFEKKYNVDKTVLDYDFKDDLLIHWLILESNYVIWTYRGNPERFEHQRTLPQWVREDLIYDPDIDYDSQGDEEEDEEEDENGDEDE